MCSNKTQPKQRKRKISEERIQQKNGQKFQNKLKAKKKKKYILIVQDLEANILKVLC